MTILLLTQIIVATSFSGLFFSEPFGKRIVFDFQFSDIFILIGGDCHECGLIQQECVYCLALLDNVQTRNILVHRVQNYETIAVAAVVC